MKTSLLKYGLIYFCVIFFSIKITAQNTFKKKDLSIISMETKVHYGFIMPHHKYIQYLSTGHFTAFELNVGKQTNGRKKWHQLYNYPYIGLSFWTANMANPEVLGSVYTLYPYLNFNLVDHRKLDFNFRLGTGIAYITKKFEPFDNYKNLLIGTNLNVAISLLYELKWAIQQHIQLSTGVGMTHFSNGALKMPNLGINIPTVNVGVAYLLNTNKPFFVPTESLCNKDTTKFEIQSIVSGGIKEIYPACGDKFGVFSWSNSLIKTWSLKRKIGVGIDLFWEFSNIRSLKRQGIEVKHAYEVIKPGVHVLHQLRFSRLSLVTQIGFYIYAKDKSDGPIYDRLALQYKLNNNILLNVALKTHFAKADFVEWGIGYSIR
ncbi:MAG TPA: acyloxyacyl hydrolase [Bacteroidales bacterium]|nr:acyloxyacyl hydrolase [Bacteroidales bacterium]